MKTLTYKIEGYASVYNPETKEVEQVFSPAEVAVECRTEADFTTAYTVAEQRAIPGTIEVNGEFDPEPDPTPSSGDSSVWDELDVAYQEGVNSAYDQ